MLKSVKVEVFVGTNLATTFTASTDEQVKEKLKSIEKRFLKRNKSTARKTFIIGDSPIINKIVYEYTKTIYEGVPVHIGGRKRSYGVQVAKYNKPKGLLCPASRP